MFRKTVLYFVTLRGIDVTDLFVLSDMEISENLSSFDRS
jgi:hypothetical protein